MAGTDQEALLRQMLGAADHVWSVGTLAGVMGFTPSGVVAMAPGGVVAVSGNARLRLAGAARLIAFETISSDPFGWNHGIALCVAGVPPTLSKTPITWELGDAASIQPEDSGRPVLDLGIGHAGVSRVLFRSEEEPAHLRGLVGAEWDAVSPALARMQGCWIVETTLARVETKADGAVPFHRLAVSRRGATHPGTTPIPSGLIPCAHVFPPHPARTRPGMPAPFDAERHRAFEAILQRHGVPRLLALKEQVSGMISARAACPPHGVLPADRHSAATIRVALRQSLARTGEPPPRDWLFRHDPPLCKALS